MNALSPITDLGVIKGKRVLVKRDELIHPVIQGNKWRKLKYNIEMALQNKHDKVITFGGAFSNHLLAVAAYANREGIDSVGIVRGDELQDKRLWSQTLEQCHQYGMKFHFVSREAYRHKSNHPEIADIIQGIPNGYVIPEGGSNLLAVKGMSEVIDECVEQIKMIDEVKKIDCIFNACGTGGTMAGLIEGCEKHLPMTKVIGVPVLKGADFLYQDVAKLAKNHQSVDWRLAMQFHFGGYAKYNDALMAFINEFRKRFDIVTEPVYTGKLFYAVWQYLCFSEDKTDSLSSFLAQAKMNNAIQFRENSREILSDTPKTQSDNNAIETLLIYHSGGLQGKSDDTISIA